MRSIAVPSIVLLAVVGLVASPAGAQSDGAASQRPPAGAVRLTLDAAITRALETSHRVGEARAREESARATLAGRQASDLPQLSVLAGYTRTNHVTPFSITLPLRPPEVVYPDIPDNYRTRLDVQWPAYTFGRTAASQRAAADEVEAVAKDGETVRADLKLDVTRAFWGVVTARESVRVLEESLRRMEASLQDVQNRLKAGLVPPSDVLSVQAQRSRQQMLLIQARNQADVAGAELARLVGVAPGTVVEPEGGLEQASSVEAASGPGQGADEATLRTLVEQAKNGRPERGALARRAAEAGERREAAVASSRPLLGVSGGVDYARPNPRFFPRTGEFKTSWDAGVNISWVLWDGGRAKADVAEASASQRAIVERLGEFDSAIEVEVRQRWLDLASGRAAVAAATDAVSAATEARRVLGERFDAGVATTTDVLDAQVALLQAQLDRTSALATLRLAEARLDRAIGR